MTDPENWMTPIQVAAYLGVTVQTLNTWRYLRNDLKFHKIGKKMVRYRAEDVEAFATARPNGTRTDTAKTG